MRIHKIIESYVEACLAAIAAGECYSAGYHADIATHYAFVIYPDLRG